MSTKPGIALVTGAGTGIGRAAALTLLHKDFKVILTGRKQESLLATVDLAGNFATHATVIPADITKPGEVKMLFSKIREKFERLDLLFNNAGIGAPSLPLEEISYEEWEAVISTNLTGAFLCTQEAFKIMCFGPRAPSKLRSVHGKQTCNLRSDKIYFT
jgi:NAD(P)-dependent dehydrogenase (short-subunit alcohol dehydrogenase family)